MRYMLLAYAKPVDWAEIDYDSPEFLAMRRFYDELGTELTASGELLATEGLADPALTRTVRATAGGPVAADGPYAEVPEVLVSFSVLDVASHERAMAVATRIVEAVGDTVEVRPLGSDPPPDGRV